MELKHKLVEELKEVGLVTAYFAAAFGILMVLKELTLAEYDITFGGFSKVMISALILAKVVVILKHVKLGEWIARHPAWVSVVLRTVLYSIGVLIVMLLEKSFETRHEAGGFVAALKGVLWHSEIHHVWVSAICSTCAILVYNALWAISTRLGKGGLARVFFESPGWRWGKRSISLD
jgi:hypothetical protein